MTRIRSVAEGADGEVLAELGRRLARSRLDRNWTQTELAQEAGVSRSTVRRLEAGESTQLTNLVRILRALGLLANLDALVPAPEVRPLQMLEREGRRRQRATGGRRKSTPRDSSWRWGDEK